MAQPPSPTQGAAYEPRSPTEAQPRPRRRRKRSLQDTFDLRTCVEAAAVLLLLVMMSQAIFGRLGDPEQTGSGPIWLRMMWLPADAVILLLAARHWRSLTRTDQTVGLTFCFAAWAFATIAWSVDSDATLRRSVGLLAGTLLGLYIAARYSPRQFAAIFAVTAVGLALGSYAVTIAFPAFGLQDNTAQSWRGLWFEKNAMGGFMTRGCLACVCAALFYPRLRIAWAAGAVLCAGLVVLSTSSTAILALATGGALMLTLWVYRGQKSWALVGAAALAIAVALVAAMFINKPSFLFDMLGKDSTLTGRNRVWAAVMNQIMLQPMQGYGYGAAWGAHEPADTIRRQLNWSAHNADNGWLDLLFQTGIVGALLVGAAMAINGRRLFDRARDAGLEIYWLSSMLVITLVTSITESVLGRSHDANWVVFVACFAMAMRLRQPNSSTSLPVVRRNTLPAAPPRPQEPSPDRLAQGWTTLAELEPIARGVRKDVAEDRLEQAATVLDGLTPASRSFVVLAALGQGATVYAHPLIRAAAIAQIIETLQAQLRTGALRSTSASRNTPAHDQRRQEALRRLQRATFEKALVDAGIVPPFVPAPDPEFARARLAEVSPNLAQILARRMEERGVPSADRSDRAWAAIRRHLETLPAQALLADIVARRAATPRPRKPLLTGSTPSTTETSGR